MPITTQFPIKVFDQEAFHQVDKVVTGFAFDIHNEFGRYMDEGLYQAELARRLREAGHDVAVEFQMTASLDDFSKDYFADLLIDCGVIVETKTASQLNGSHKGQTLNYLYLCELHHGTMLNFRPLRVEHKFVSTGLTHVDRQQYEVQADGWIACSPECERLKRLVLDCLSEWGAFLDPNLYRDALVHFFGGKVIVERNVSVISAGAKIGTQIMRLINADVAFSVTASTHSPDSVFAHQRRFLKHTTLNALHWLNLNHHHIDLRTITQ